ncbi:N-myc-interactor isoform X1 [Labrus mixtus]|uniref:N-myc-interactor isoform X1 n=1 Tax=Labrus mixtus TaxID=508554 RepID=UPI0029C065CF|nr:N-myc-interactor isoform X1 [Labrus mixtus]XP_060890415.1 N-myc-interactor isoform X1 [Labrus mixtus]
MADMTKKGEEDLQLEEAKKELQTWKNKTKEAEDVIARLTLEKLDEEEVKTKAQQEMMARFKEQEKLKEEFNERKMEVQKEINDLSKQNQNLIDNLNKCRDKLQKKKNECTKLKQKFKIYAQIPDSEVEFSARSDKQVEDEDQPIRGEFVIVQRVSAPLKKGQALITFEEETVASQILMMAMCSVACDAQIMDVKPERITMDPSVKFEVHLPVSRKQLCVSGVLSSLSEERIKDCLQISFSRPSRGGGEVEEVLYDQNTGTAQVTFLHPGVADSLVLKGEYLVDLDSEMKVQVGPVYTYKLSKFQTFCGSSRRTVLLDGIKEMMDQEELQDHLEIHFQKPRNQGGEIESIKYVSRQEEHLLAFFTCEEEK